MEADVADDPLLVAADAIADVDMRQGERVRRGGGRQRLGFGDGRAHVSSMVASTEVEIRLTAITSDAIASASNSTSHQYPAITRP